MCFGRSRFLEQGLADARAGRPFDTAAMAVRQARLAYEWQTSFGDHRYTTTPVGDAVEISHALRDKYAGFFASCKQ